MQHGADPNIRNTDGKTALDVAEASAKLVLTGRISSKIFYIYIYIYFLFLSITDHSAVHVDWSVNRLIPIIVRNQICL